LSPPISLSLAKAGHLTTQLKKLTPIFAINYGGVPGEKTNK